MREEISNTNNSTLVNWLFIVAGIAHLPLGLYYAKSLWGMGHYQFFPLLMGVVGWIIYERLSGLKPTSSPPQPRWSMALLAFNFLVLVSSGIIFRASIWFVSFLIYVLNVVYWRYGQAGVRVALPPWLILLLILPLPMNLDSVLITKMQFFASQLASWILDALGQIHFREGVVLITETNQFMTEEACSGIRSLFSSLAAISIFGVIRNYPWWRHLFNLFQTTIWVMVGNSLRVALVVYGAEHWTPAIASGTNHEMLGLGVFVLIFILSLSTDRALNAVLPDPRSVGDSEATMATTPTSITPTQTTGLINPAITWSLIVLFLIAGVFSGRLYYMREYYGRSFGSKFGDAAQALESASLSSNFNGWEAKSFEYKERSEASLFAPESFLWVFEKANQKVTISVDAPYAEFHNLVLCYRGIGWQADYLDEYASPPAVGSQVPDCTTLTMEKAGEYGLVLFSGHDREGQLVLPDQGLIADVFRRNEIVRNFNLVFGLLDPNLDTVSKRYSLPISQIQLLYQSGRPISMEEKSELLRLFLAARNELLKSPRFKN